MAGLYIHIPFCRSRCVYCGFFSTTSLEQCQRYVDALCKEMEIRTGQGEAIETIYLGGGTPSQLSIPLLHQIFDAIYNINKVEENAEVTMEVNPDDVTPAFAEAITHLPINRISMGAQTFSDERLQFLHRRHTATQVSAAVDLLRKVGIGNTSVDLMYGFPSETLAEWEQDIQQALQLNVEHLSAYCLMIEEGTPLHRAFSLGKIKEVDEEVERQMYEALIDRLTAAGYEHYELSNFALPGYRSRHNSSYWTNKPYIGLGAAAHSFDGSCRSWNVSNLQRYIDGINNGSPEYDYEFLDDDTRYNDAVTVRLRTREGLPLDQLSPRHRIHCMLTARHYLTDGLLELTPQHYLKLTRQGLFVSDMVMSDLMIV